MKILPFQQKYYLFRALQIIFILLLPHMTLYLIAMQTGLPGRKGGPQDAFRHTFSCALAAHWISPGFVATFTRLTERDQTSKFDLMDIHNNRIGAEIGEQASKLGWNVREIYNEVGRRVAAGQIHAADSRQITWLPPENWSNGL